jgi:hypothetical protein
VYGSIKANSPRGEHAKLEVSTTETARLPNRAPSTCDVRTRENRGNVPREVAPSDDIRRDSARGN